MSFTILCRVIKLIQKLNEIELLARLLCGYNKSCYTRQKKKEEFRINSKDTRHKARKETAKNFILRLVRAILKLEPTVQE
jgi:hypothetical protein